MISLIIKSYLSILLGVGIGSLFLLVVGFYFIFRAPRKRASKSIIPEGGFQAIAGDDVIATQLDLARAYLETANLDLAQSILKQVLKQGNKSQQDEARQLLSIASS